MYKRPGVIGQRCSNVRPRKHRWLVAALALLCLWPTLVSAGVKTYGTITVSVEPPADADSDYGYAVYRVSVTNRGKAPSTVTVILPDVSWNDGDSISRLSRTLRVEPNSTAVAELLQPPLPISGDDVRVIIDGQTQRDRVSLSMVDHMGYAGSGEPILRSHGVVGPVSASFDKAMAMISDERGSSSSGGFGGYTDEFAHMARAERPVAEWSGNWLAYSRYLMVVLSEDELRDAPAEVDAALRDYVAAGGAVVVLGKGDQLPELRTAWTAGSTAQWQAQDGRSVEMTLGLGKVHRFAANKLARFDHDQWQQWINQVSRESRQRSLRMDAGDAEYRLPMLDSLQVPARGLLAMMLVFTLLIGPGNILLLSWLKRRMWLLWTIPAIAFVFGGAVLAYSLLNEGIQPRARTASITLLDQTTRQAVTLSITGYYAPLTPGDGLRFSDRTLITPQTGEIDEYYDYNRNRGRSRTIDVSNGQHLIRGWIVARVPAHFDLRHVEARRERLDISRNDDGGLTVVNGLGLPIKRLLLADAQGKLYELSGLAPGASADATLFERAEALAEEDINPPVGDDSVYTSTVPADIINQLGVLEAARQLQAAPERSLSKSMYLAFMDNSSFAEPGLAGLSDHETTGIVVGRWQEAK